MSRFMPGRVERPLLTNHESPITAALIIGRGLARIKRLGCVSSLFRYERIGSLKTESKRTCQVCGSQIQVGLDLCPVCAFRAVLEGDRETIELPFEPMPSDPLGSLGGLRFEHYQILTGEDGTPLELGRGGMGVTYKAIDINLQCVVALKVINPRFMADESVRRRFVREARAAASIRHPNVASVFHLGQSGDNYFYAMEFVEGEPLDHAL
jgi:hypothetical protein